MMVEVKIWVDENEDAPVGFESTAEKFWAGASWGWAHVGQIPESAIRQVAYGECFYEGDQDWPIERVGKFAVSVA